MKRLKNIINKVLEIKSSIPGTGKEALNKGANPKKDEDVTPIEKEKYVHVSFNLPFQSKSYSNRDFALIIKEALDPVVNNAEEVVTKAYSTLPREYDEIHSKLKNEIIEIKAKLEIINNNIKKETKIEPIVSLVIERDQLTDTLKIKQIKASETKSQYIRKNLYSSIMEYSSEYKYHSLYINTKIDSVFDIFRYYIDLDSLKAIRLSTYNAEPWYGTSGLEELYVRYKDYMETEEVGSLDYIHSLFREWVYKILYIPEIFVSADMSMNILEENTNGNN